MISINGVYKLANVVIVNPIRIDLVSWVVIFGDVTLTIVIHVKDDFYDNQFMLDMFFLLIVEVFECLH